MQFSDIELGRQVIYAGGLWVITGVGPVTSPCKARYLRLQSQTDTELVDGFTEFKTRVFNVSCNDLECHEKR